MLIIDILNRRPQSSRFGPPEREDATKSKKNDDDQDNWDLPEGGLP